MKFKRKSVVGLLVAMGLVLLPFMEQASAGPNANAVLSVDIDTSGNKIDDGNTSGTAVAGTDIVVEIFISGLAGPIVAGDVTFDTDKLTVKSAAPAAGFFALGTTANTVSFGAVLFGTVPSGTLTNDYFGTVILTPNAGVTASTQFEVGVNGRLFNVNAAPGSPTNITAAMPLLFNGQTANAPTTNAPTAADADYDDDGIVGVNDFLLFIAKFGASQGDGKYEAKYDLDSDGQVGVSDFLVFVGFFGQTTRNQDPVLKRIGDQSVPAGVTLTLELVASDPNGDDLTYSVSGARPAGSSLSGNTFNWTPTSGQSGTHQVTFTVRDGRGGIDSETITISVVAFRFDLTKYQVETELPSFVNIMFQVQDSDGQGVNFLTTEHFEVKEDGQPVSPTESAMNIRKRATIPYTLKTVLMLDTSESVRDNLEDIKTAAITLVENMTAQQEIALYEFSEETVLLQDFTDDVGALTRAINAIRLGYGSTRLYGSIIDGCARWEDIYTVNEVQQGFLIILTDGKDERGFETERQAISARRNKNIYTIGLGAEIEPGVLNRLGNAGSFTLSDVNDLGDQFIEIQNEMALFADSFYRLNYRSPKRGDRVRTLELSVKNNQNYSTVRGEFNSKCFFSTRNPIVVVNPSCSNNRGIEELQIPEGNAVQLQAATYLGTQSPQYSWTSSDNHIVVVIQDADDPAMALATAVGDSGQTATVTVFDRANGLNKQVKVEVGGQVEQTSGGSGSSGGGESANSFTLLGGASLEMVWIDPGTFQMGSPSSEPGRDSDEGPVHEVTISQGFYLGKYEVTQGQWESVMGTRPWQGQDYVRSGSEYPAVYVSWEDAQEFIRRLNTSLDRNVYRLPTEAEWEYACRAGTTTRWSFGDDESQLRHYAWYYDNAWDVGEQYGHSVGTKRANPWGLYDMHGNVWEWVQDWYAGNYYHSSPSVDPQGPSAGSLRVVRGGNFSSNAQSVRSAYRGNISPGARHNAVGFRLLRQVQ